MRNLTITAITAATLVASTSAVQAGGVAAPIIEPTVFVDADDGGSMGSLGGIAPLLIGGLVIGTILLLEDDDTEEDD